MNTPQIANRLVELCKEGQWEEAQTELYATDAVSIEPEASPAFDKETKGLEAIVEKGKKFDGMVDTLHLVRVSEPLVTPSAIAFTLEMDITMKGKERETWTELCLYQVKDEKIVSEQFFI
jgi:hypothetical protein